MVIRNYNGIIFLVPTNTSTRKTAHALALDATNWDYCDYLCLLMFLILAVLAEVWCALCQNTSQMDNLV